MQEKKSILVVRCKLKIPSLGITVRRLNHVFGGPKMADVPQKA